MSTVFRVFFLFLLVLVVGGAAFLAIWDQPPMLQQIEMTVPDETLPR